LPRAGWGRITSSRCRQRCTAASCWRQLISYTILQLAIIKHPEAGSKLAEALGKDVKGKVSLAAYLVAIPAAFVQQWISDALYVAVAAMWLVPDRRIESNLRSE
jgi:hypothetical protein